MKRSLASTMIFKTTHRIAKCCAVLVAASLAWAATSPLHAENTISIDTVAVDPGATGISVNVSITNDDPVHGISLSMRYDPTNLALSRVDPGDSTLTAPFFEYKHDAATGEIVSGIILTYPDGGGVVTNGELAPTDAANPHVIAQLVFSVDITAAPGDIAVNLENGLGDPPIMNSFSNSGTNVAIPQINFTDGAVSVNNLYRLRLADANAVPNYGFNVTAEIQSPQPVSGGSFAYTYDNLVFTATDASYLLTDADSELRQQVDSGSAGIEFFQFRNEPDFFPGQDRAVVGFVNDFSPPFDDQVISSTGPGEWKSVVRFSMTVVDDPNLVGLTRELVLTDANLQGLVDNIFIVGESGVQPELFHGQVPFIQGIPFSRGRINPDDSVDISDAIWLLQWQFIGLAEPVCLKAANINGDGGHDISDVIFLLSWLLLGSHVPPEPVNNCGISDLPNDEMFSCEQNFCN